ncbi:hypothetical protein B8V81_0486 [Paenibacillus pasadenensis]|uniref:Uncharacterized protein n=1 Tax=Paenibacillus pasadenensis TaxID=217090 RepID=A0A2N5NDD3_9BACL|nr:hypothetical protein B8V81_0486 [Paenibacillus pasadenensis]
MASFAITLRTVVDFLEDAAVEEDVDSLDELLDDPPPL